MLLLLMQLFSLFLFEKEQNTSCSSSHRASVRAGRSTISKQGLAQATTRDEGW